MEQDMKLIRIMKDKDHEVIEQSIVLILANNLFRKKNTSWSCEQTVLFFFFILSIGQSKTAQA